LGTATWKPPLSTLHPSQQHLQAVTNPLDTLAPRRKSRQIAELVADIPRCLDAVPRISLVAIHVHSQGKPFTALAMVPSHLVEKWARGACVTLPEVRVFLIDDLRNGGDENKSHGVNEVRLRRGHIAREGFKTSLQ
jgi:hypothetical protein